MVDKIIVTRAQFMEAVEAVWGEIVYQNSLPRRTGGSEATSPASFATLGRVYLRRLEDAWSDNAGNEAANPVLRKLAAIFVRGMVYCGVTQRLSARAAEQEGLVKKWRVCERCDSCRSTQNKICQRPTEFY